MDGRKYLNPQPGSTGLRKV